MNRTSFRIEQRAATENDPRWASVLARDSNADGKFYYSVATTGVYCRPSCGSRLARPENVRFFSTTLEAESAGFRPCKRCKPDQKSLQEQYAAKVTKACRILEEAEEAPELNDLAKQLEMSPFHFHRIFKQIAGLTPKQYFAAHRESRLRNELVRTNTITEAIFSAGYNSNGRFYEKSDEILGMTPTTYKSGGADAEIIFAIGECSLGAILVAKSHRGICAILLGDDPEELIHNLQDRFPRANLIGGEPEFERTVATVIGFVEAPNVGLNLPLDVRGTAFQQRVWKALREVPAGKTVSYAEIAARIGSPRAIRAVAQACAANTLAVAIPCHRVIRNDGAMGGYRWGVERKRELLKKESKL